MTSPEWTGTASLSNPCILCFVLRNFKCIFHKEGRLRITIQNYITVVLAESHSFQSQNKFAMLNVILKKGWTSTKYDSWISMAYSLFRTWVALTWATARWTYKETYHYDYDYAPQNSCLLPLLLGTPSDVHHPFHSSHVGLFLDKSVEFANSEGKNSEQHTNTSEAHPCDTVHGLTYLHSWPTSRVLGMELGDRLLRLQQLLDLRHGHGLGFLGRRGSICASNLDMNGCVSRKWWVICSWSLKHHVINMKQLLLGYCFRSWNNMAKAELLGMTRTCRLGVKHGQMSFNSVKLPTTNHSPLRFLEEKSFLFRP